MLVANIAGSDLIIVLVIAVVVLFGGSQLPKIARNVGTAGKEFRKAQAEAEAEKAAEDAAKAGSAPQAVAAAPLPQTVVPTPTPAPAPAPLQAPAPAPANDDRVTISKADLEALLDERLGKGSKTQD